MLDNVFQWADLIYALVGALATLVPSIIALVNSIKAKRRAKTEAEKEKANNDMREALDGFINDAEATYNEVNVILKSQGKSAGPAKKQTVLTLLQSYALSKGYTFDVDYWSAKIDDVVALTRKVNAEQKK